MYKYNYCLYLLFYTSRKLGMNKYFFNIYCVLVILQPKYPVYANMKKKNQTIFTFKHFNQLM